MSGETHVYAGYSLIMIGPLRQGHKNKGRGKEKGVGTKIGERHTREERENFVLGRRKSCLDLGKGARLFDNLHSRAKTKAV